MRALAIYFVQITVMVIMTSCCGIIVTEDIKPIHLRGHEFSEISPPFQKKPALDPATDPIPNQPTTVPTPFPYSLPTLKPTIALDFNLDPAIVAGTVVLIVSAWIVLYLRSEEELASLNYIGKAYIVVPEYFIKGSSALISYDALFHSDSYRNEPFFWILLVSKTSVFFFWSYLIFWLLSKAAAKDGWQKIRDLLQQKEDMIIVRRLIIVSLFLLSVVDLTLLRFLPWRRSGLTEALLGYPRKTIALVCVFSSLTMSSIQLIAVIFGETAGSGRIGVHSTALGILTAFSVLGIPYSAYYAWEFWHVDDKDVKQAMKEASFEEATKDDIAMNPMAHTSTVKLNWTDFSVITEEISRKHKRDRELPEIHVASTRVFFGWHISRKMPIALKVFRPRDNESSGKDAYRRAKWELTRMNRAGLHLPNSVKGLGLLQGVIQDSYLASLLSVVDNTEEVTAIVMEYVHGCSLEEKLHPSRASTLNLLEKLEILTAVVGNVSALQEKGMVYGNVHPSHVLLSIQKPYKVRLINFSKVGQVRGVSQDDGRQNIERVSSFRSAGDDDDDDEDDSQLPERSPYLAPEVMAELSKQARVSPATSSGSLGSSSAVNFSRKLSMGFALKDRPSFSTVIVAARRTDIYAIAILVWQVFAYPLPLPHWNQTDGFGAGIRDGEMTRSSDEIEAPEGSWGTVGARARPSIDALPKNTPSSVKQMIKECWSDNRALRKMAIDFLVVLDHSREVVRGGQFDVFCSYNWGNQELTKRLYTSLHSEGYRVWFDLNDMGHKLDESMRKGISSSSVFLACVSKKYQESPNCMFELREAHKQGKKIVSVFLDDSPSSWATAEIKEICDFKTTKFLKADMLTGVEWDLDEGVGDDVQKQLRDVVISIVVVLEENNCHPSLKTGQ